MKLGGPYVDGQQTLNPSHDPFDLRSSETQSFRMSGNPSIDERALGNVIERSRLRSVRYPVDRDGV